MKNFFMIFFILFLPVLSFKTWATASPHSSNDVYILSLCSLKSDLTKRYPNSYLNELSKRSVVLEDAISYDGWRGLQQYLNNISYSEIKKSSYDFFIPQSASGSSIKNVSELSLRLKRFENKEVYFQNLENFLKTNKKHFFVSHLEWLHYPFAFENETQMQEVLKQTTFEDFKQKQVYYLSLLPYEVWQKKFPNELKKLSLEDAQAYSWKIFKDEEQVKKWKQSSKYQEEIKQLNLAYDHRFESLDKSLRQLLEGKEDKAYILMMACHSEAFAEKDNVFLHGNPFHEETSKLFGLIHLPGQKRAKLIKTQVGMEAVVKNFAWLISKNESLSKQESFLKKNLNEPHLLQYDCEGKNLALRIQGKFRFIYNLSTLEKEYYDFSKDPLMQNNIIDKLDPHLAQKYQDELLEKFKEKTFLSFEMAQEGFCPYQFK